MNINFKISYGLYVLSTKYGEKNNGCMINTFMQHTGAPEMFSITISKDNYSHKLLTKTEKCAVAVLSTNTTFDLIKNFGFSSGKDRDKFENISTVTSKQGFLMPAQNIIGYIEMDIEKTVDYPTHTQFIGKPTEKMIYSDNEALTYDYYQKYIKPKPEIKQTGNEKIYVCSICGYIHKGEMPDDFICPICKHPKQYFTLVENP